MASGNHGTPTLRPRTRYRDVSISDSLELLATETVSDEMAKTLADGFGVLVKVLKAWSFHEGMTQSTGASLEPYLI